MHRPPAIFIWSEWRTLIAAALLVVAILFGGGGTPAPGSELVVELAAIAAAIAWFWLAYLRGEAIAPVRDGSWLVALFALIAIPLMQLLPLPPSLWHALPGRGTEVEALGLVGRANTWMPISVSPTRTFASLLSLVPPIVLAIMVASLSRGQRTILIICLGALGILSALIGTVQLASGNANWLRFYSDTHYGFSTGFQANRNAQADILLISATAMIVAFWQAGPSQNNRLLRAIMLAGAALLLLSIIFTGSRTGLALILIPLVVAIMTLVPKKALLGRKGLLMIGAGLMVIGGSAYALHGNNRVNKTLQRFDDLEDARPKIWEDSLYTVSQTWPIGTGVGTFQSIFPSEERLEYVRPNFANRAHNDYLEFVIESGAVGILYLLAVLVIAGIRIIKLNRKIGHEGFYQAAFVTGSFLILFFHSIVDYPLRSMSLACIAALCAGLLSGSTVDDVESEP
ncbi:O-antigen ligase family protein [Stakelama marina]|uniref:O-antigen ligase family protein n=1 Tax=Stakelama marina TaxID=2826939 RepID=A0A8T4IC11_9SPHN|nr:O-antigen ligase family protein [Stakelama marina]MBR0552100.1 O-antigen ligase family protein [Stakelama marina]